MVFETDRTQVRELRESDFEPFHEMQSDEVVMRYTTGEPLDAAENRRQLEFCCRVLWQRGERLLGLGRDSQDRSAVLGDLCDCPE